MEKFKTLADAVALAEFAHRNQKDKAGLPYIDHPKRVLATVQAQSVAPYVQMAAVLHDVPEDTTFSHDVLLTLGFSEAVVGLTRLLDRDYSKRVWDARIAARDPHVFELSLHIDESEAYRQYDEANFPGPVRDMDKDGFYYYSIKADRNATIIKLADIADNMAGWRLAYLSEETQNRLRAKYGKALAILNPAPVNHGMLTDYVHDPFTLR